MRIIYDVGSNNGDDIPYYLSKSDLVVAIEANPTLVEVINTRFEKEISAGRLVVEGYVVSTEKAPSIVPFYIAKDNHVLSQFVTPPDADLDKFQKVDLPSKNLVSIIHRYGSPHYVKIDIEHYDHILLKDMFINKIFPPYVSAEIHEIEVFSVLLSYGGYNSFKLLDGDSITKIYGQHQIQTSHGMIDYSFPYHSAGPYGNDIKGKWQKKNEFFSTLANAGLGWKDIHASNVDYP